ncbi:Glucans biosynthesis glucosyltransferase H [Dissostichus eleginoides]|uniref:Glucans biosynthesis glucosyltransferase H n=1 Tax=Dissostichus eleginoides TaxID=100907 RepID=A0AAD9CCU2_DISEL|nr:Glucans biosynthesis glucosyltransferase H [Dissostichus eleginoides]
MEQRQQQSVRCATGVVVRGAQDLSSRAQHEQQRRQEATSRWENTGSNEPMEISSNKQGQETGDANIQEGRGGLSVMGRGGQ